MLDKLVVHRVLMQGLVVCLTLGASVAMAEDAARTAAAEILGRDGAVLGRAQLTETPRGVLIEMGFEGLSEGVHAFHIHEVGACDPSDEFKSAGGHFNPTHAKHGFLAEGGAHLGDLPNIHAPADASFVVEIFVSGLTLAEGPGTLFDEDGSSLVVHEHRDDYVSDPAGAAGPRIACGVIRR